MLNPFLKILGKSKDKRGTERYRIDEDFIEARVEVKDFPMFLNSFSRFLNDENIKKLFKCAELSIQLDEETKIPVKFEHAEGVGYVDNIKISCGGELVGIIVAKYIDRKFFLLSPAVRRKVKPEEVKYLKQEWKVPIEPVLVYIKPNDIEEFAKELQNFVEQYSDSYPNELVARVAPLAKEVK